MESREEALRRILDAAGAKLTDVQRREILGHLEDSIDAKVRTGMEEPEATAQAFEELGPVEKIARQFPEGRPALVTPEGARLLPSTTGWALAAYTLLVVFTLLQIFVTPKFREVYDSANIPMPGLTYWVLQASLVLSTCAPVLVPGLLLLAWFIPRMSRWARMRDVSLGIVIVLSLGCLAVALGLVLPLVSLLQGVGT